MSLRDAHATTFGSFGVLIPGVPKVSLLVWLPLDQESVKVMQLPIQWKPLDDNLMQKPKYVACCFFTHYLMDVMLTVADIVALCEMNNLDARGVFLLCSPNKLLTMEHAVVRYAGRCQHQMVYPRLLPPQVELVGTSPSSSRYEEDGLRLLVLPIVGRRLPYYTVGLGKTNIRKASQA